MTILDISRRGFRIEATDALRVGESVKLRVERGVEYPAEIRWALGQQAGGVFLAATDVEAV